MTVQEIDPHRRSPPGSARRLDFPLRIERVALVVVPVLLTLVILPLLGLGPHSGYGFVYNVCWARGFDAALFEGQLYPRWLTAMNGGAGSPVFFYAPIPFYVRALAGLVSSDVSIQLGTTIWVTLLASSVAFFALARRLVDPIAAAIGALTYALMPYHLPVDGWVRQALGEFARTSGCRSCCSPLVASPRPLRRRARARTLVRGTRRRDDERARLGVVGARISSKRRAFPVNLRMHARWGESAVLIQSRLIFRG